MVANKSIFVEVPVREMIDVSISFESAWEQKVKVTIRDPRVVPAKFHTATFEKDGHKGVFRLPGIKNTTFIKVVVFHREPGKEWAVSAVRAFPIVDESASTGGITVRADDKALMPDTNESDYNDSVVTFTWSKSNYFNFIGRDKMFLG